MFGVLLESRARHARQRGGAAVSALVHIGLIFLGVVATRSAPVNGVSDRSEEARVIYTPPQPTTTVSIDGPRRSAGPIVEVGLPRPEIIYVDVPQTELPPIGESPVATSTEWGTSRTIGAPDFGDSGPRGGASPDGIAFASGVDKPAIALAGNPPPRYPDVLRHAGIQGKVTIQVVVDTTGRADMTTLKVVSSDHALFQAAVVAVLPAYKFMPAVSGDRKVKMWVLVPFVFEVRK